MSASGIVVERLAWIEPERAAAALHGAGRLAFLDSARGHPRLARFSYVAAAPFGRFTVTDGRAFWNGEALADAPAVALAALLSRYAFPADPALPPFQGGAIGTLDFELATAFDRTEAAPPASWGAAPEADLAFFDVVLAFDHASHDLWLLSSGWPETAPRARHARAKARAEAVRGRLGTVPPAALPPAALPREAWQSNFSRETYRRAVAAVVEAIRDGEIFQANIAQRFLAPLTPGFDPFAFYRQLRQHNAAPFAAYLDQGERIIASSSPELFLKVAGDSVETRPIKGTARRPPGPEADRAAAEALLRSGKDRAENAMIVDLLRNDLSRVCRPGSIAVPEFCALETYAGVHHLVSSVTGRLAAGCGAADLVAAAFPCGSVTGAPKLQAMRVIRRIEGERRGIYCGSIACFGFDGSLTASVAIRTVTFQNGRAVFQAGGGVTLRSDPDAEFDETLAKADRIFAAFDPAHDGPRP